MDANTITTLIGSLGFPIVMCGVMFYYLQETQKKHDEEIKTITAALHQNTLALQELKDILTYLRSAIDGTTDRTNNTGTVV